MSKAFERDIKTITVILAIQVFIIFLGKYEIVTFKPFGKYIITLIILLNVEVFRRMVRMYTKYLNVLYYKTSINLWFIIMIFTFMLSAEKFGHNKVPLYCIIMICFMCICLILLRNFSPKTYYKLMILIDRCICRNMRVDIDKIIKDANINNGKDVLQIGVCSPWITIKVARALGNDGKLNILCTEVDNQEILQYITEKYPNINVIKCDGDEMSFQDNDMDAVILPFILDKLESKYKFKLDDERDEIIQEVLKYANNAVKNHGARVITTFKGKMISEMVKDNCYGNISEEDIGYSKVINMN